VKEDDYIIATNRVKVTEAINLLRETLSGEKWGISDKAKSDMIGKLCAIEDKLFSMIEIDAGG